MDFVLEQSNGSAPKAIECKISRKIRKEDFKGLIAFGHENEGAKLILVCQKEFDRNVEVALPGKSVLVIRVLHWKSFSKEIWQ